jgi:dihydroorotate dehydrogenase (NAD+) catalytic subunit
MAVDLSVHIGTLRLKTPVIAASGTFGFGREYGEFFDLGLLGGISVKGLTLLPRKGNLAPRVAETPAGMLNSVGLQNPGVDAFIRDEIPFLRRYDTAIIANAAANTAEEYAEICERLSGADIDAIELNVSCPNVKAGCLAFGTSPEGITQVVSAVRPVTKKPLIVKLTPNVSSIAEVARAAEAAGADAVSLINTLTGMAIDIETQRPILHNNTGGLSGPAVRPVAVRMTWEAARAVDIPVIGMGGIMTGGDAVEFLLAGASAVMVGTASFQNPLACLDITRGIADYMEKYGFERVDQLTGALILN